MSRQNVYNNNETDLLLTKIDSLIQKSRATRNRITGHQQMGGNFNHQSAQFVDLDTPVVSNYQRGGNFNYQSDQFVDLDTPVVSNYQRGGDGEANIESVEKIDLTEKEDKPKPTEKFQGVDKIDDISKIDFGLEKADEVLSKFDMLGGGCGCGGDEYYPVHSGNCNLQRTAQRTVQRTVQSGGSNQNILADLDSALGSVDSLLRF